MSSRKEQKRKIAVFCSYIPREIFHALGFTSARLLPNKDNLVDEGYFQTYMCSFARQVFSAIKSEINQIDGLVFANSCHAMENLYETMKRHFPDKKIFLLNVPKEQTKDGIKYYANELKQMIQEMELEFQVHTTEKLLQESILLFNVRRTMMEQLNRRLQDGKMKLTASEWSSLNDKYCGDIEECNDYVSKLLQKKMEGTENKENHLRVMVYGSVQAPSNLLEIVEEYGGTVVANLHCNSFQRDVQLVEKNMTEETIESIAKAYLNRFPCGRQHKISEKIESIMNMAETYKVDAVILSLVKFCIDQSYEVIAIWEELKRRNIPCHVIDSEYSGAGSEQIHIRIQAFFERVRLRNTVEPL